MNRLCIFCINGHEIVFMHMCEIVSFLYVCTQKILKSRYLKPVVINYIATQFYIKKIKKNKINLNILVRIQIVRNEILVRFFLRVSFTEFV